MQVLASAGQAGAQLVEDDRQALAEGQAQDVVDQVEVHRVLGLGHREQVLPGAGLSARNALERQRRGRPRGVGLGGGALDELLPDQGLRPDDAGGVAAEVVEPRLGDGQDDGRLLDVGGRAFQGERDAVALGYVQLLDAAHLDPGDLHVLARNDREGAVEDGPHPVLPPGARARGQHGDDGRARPHQR